MQQSLPERTSTAARAGPCVELARYRVADTERILVGQRVLGIVRVTDVPASGRGRRSWWIVARPCRATYVEGRGARARYAVDAGPPRAGAARWNSAAPDGASLEWGGRFLLGVRLAAPFLHPGRGCQRV